ncbi:MAG: hypothetical protein NWE83_04465 [Candidatus Bathyarchaeota archaeon]|nr:hypothetical protein [Candidatus Bathyarchaeota archaeon]
MNINTIEDIRSKKSLLTSIREDNESLLDSQPYGEKTSIQAMFDCALTYCDELNTEIYKFSCLSYLSKFYFTDDGSRADLSRKQQYYKAKNTVLEALKQFCLYKNNALIDSINGETVIDKVENTPKMVETPIDMLIENVFINPEFKKGLERHREMQNA